MTTDRSLRVGVVAPYDLSAAGGINNQIRAQAKALRALGHTAEIFGAASGGVGPGEHTVGRTLRVTFGGTESGLGVDPRAFAAIKRMMREQFDVVHVHEPMVPIVPWLAVLGARVPVIGTFHVHREHGHGFYRRWSWLLAPIVRRIDVRIAVSQAARRTVAAHFPGEYEIVPNGIDADAFRTCERCAAGGPAGPPRVVYIGRLEPRKGVDHLVRAVARVRQRMPEVELIIVGDGSMRQLLERLARDLGVAAQFAGRVPDAALPAYLHDATAMCAPAIGGESFGIVLLEAMAAGTPVIASRIEGYAALAGSSGAALLVQPADADALADALASVVESEAQRRALVERGRALAREYDWRTLAPRLVEIYRRAISARRETHRSTPGSSR